MHCPECERKAQCFCQETENGFEIKLEYVLFCKNCGIVRKRRQEREGLALISGHWTGTCPFCKKKAKRHRLFLPERMAYAFN